MGLFEIILLALGVSLDSFAICVCKGIEAKNKLNVAIKCATSFSVFQFLMTLFGFFIGGIFNEVLDKFDHYIVFFIFLFFSINMFKEAFSKDKKNENNSLLSIIIISFFSSLDSLGVGISLALFEEQILLASLIMFGITFLLCFFGVLIGKFLGAKHKKTACIIGGIILLILGVKLLIEHIFF